MKDTEEKNTNPEIKEEQSLNDEQSGNGGEAAGNENSGNDLNSAVIEVLKSVYDPEIPVNIYELGLIYSVNTDENGKVIVEMTLTSPACPVAGSLPPEVEGKIRSIPGVTDCTVKVVWDPPWGMHMMSEEAKLQLNLY